MHFNECTSSFVQPSSLSCDPTRSHADSGKQFSLSRSSSARDSVHIVASFQRAAICRYACATHTLCCVCPSLCCILFFSADFDNTQILPSDCGIRVKPRTLLASPVTRIYPCQLTRVVSEDLSESRTQSDGRSSTRKSQINNRAARPAATSRNEDN